MDNFDINAFSDDSNCLSKEYANEIFNRQMAEVMEQENAFKKWEFAYNTVQTDICNIASALVIYYPEESLVKPAIERLKVLDEIRFKIIVSSSSGQLPDLALEYLQAKKEGK